MIVSRGNMLKFYLNNLREVFEDAWSIETVHKSVKYSHNFFSKSEGQCFVTSWIMKEIFEDKCIGKDFIVCRGTVYYKDIKIIEDHCWIEGKIGNKCYIIDLTQDQKTDNRVFILSKKEYLSSKYRYVIRKKYISAIDVNIGAMERVNILKERMGIV